MVSNNPPTALEATGAAEEARPSSPSSFTLPCKWLGFVSALWVQAISGNNYTFANYSVELKAILAINQVKLNGLSSAKDVGKAFGVVAGILCNYLPPWSILLIGSLVGMLGYGAQWLVISRKIKPLPYWLMCIVLCLGGNSTTWMNTAVLVTCVRNFSRNRGPASGILKAYVGLSTAIFTDLCTALFAGDAAAFVLMLALIPLGVCVVAMFLLKPVDCELNAGGELEESRCFSVLNSVAIVLAFYLLAYDLSGIKKPLLSKLIAGGLCIILVAPVALPFYLLVKVARRRRQTTLSESSLQQNEIDQGGKEAVVRRNANKMSTIEGEGMAQRDGEVSSTQGERMVRRSFEGIEMGHGDAEEASTTERGVRVHACVHMSKIQRDTATVLGGVQEVSEAPAEGMEHKGVSITKGEVIIQRGADVPTPEGDVAIHRDVEAPSTEVEAMVYRDTEVSTTQESQGKVNTYIGRKKLGDEFSVLESIKTADFWLLFFCFLCGVGTGLAVINNMGQIGQSMGYTSVSVFLSLISIWGFFGRLGSGVLSEYLIRWKAVPRPLLLAASQLVMALGYILLATGAPGSLYIGSVLVGVCYGVRLSVSVPVTSEMFGLKSFGLMYNLLILNLPLGSVLFSSLLAGFLYDHEAAKDGSSTACLGIHCYRLVFLLMAAVSGIGFVLDCILTLRTRSLYQKIYRSKHC